MPRWMPLVFAGVVGYLAGALLGYALVMALSGNTHDRELEAAMTAAFFSGPLTGLLCLPLAWWGMRRGRRR